MKPDPDMMSQSCHEARKSLSSVGAWLSSVGFAFGSDADHDVTHRTIWQLAEDLEEHARKLRIIAAEGNKRTQPTHTQSS